MPKHSAFRRVCLITVHYLKNLISNAQKCAKVLLEEPIDRICHRQIVFPSGFFLLLERRYGDFYSVIFCDQVELAIQFKSLWYLDKGTVVQ